MVLLERADPIMIVRVYCSGAGKVVAESRVARYGESLSHIKAVGEIDTYHECSAPQGI